MYVAASVASHLFHFSKGWFGNRSIYVWIAYSAHRAIRERRPWFFVRCCEAMKTTRLKKTDRFRMAFVVDCLLGEVFLSQKAICHSPALENAACASSFFNTTVFSCFCIFDRRNTPLQNFFRDGGMFGNETGKRKHDGDELEAPMRHENFGTFFFLERTSPNSHNTNAKLYQCQDQHHCQSLSSPHVSTFQAGWSLRETDVS